MTRILPRLPFLLAFLFLVACAPGAPDQGPELTSCQLFPDVTAECGSISVPENRDEPQGQQIDIHFAVVRAESSISEDDPVFMLAGGPGQSAVEAFPLLLGFYDALNQNRDIVLVDQRGTGQSNALDCPEIDDLPLDSTEEDVTLAVQTCRERLAPEADLTQYITDIAMQDLDAVREALGYEQINLVGTSYGSRAALRYMALFPERVRSAVLNAVVSHELVLQLQAPVDGQRALALLFERCRDDEACAAQYPDFEETFAEVRAGLSGGREVTVTHPVSGKRETVTINEDEFMQGVFSLLYSPDLVSLLPLMIDRIAETGDYGPLLAQIMALTSNTGLHRGMFFAVVCSEDAPLLDLEQAEAIRGDSFFPLAADDLAAQCENWPQAEVSDSFRQPLNSDIPTLLLSGEADPITPPSYAEQVAQGLSNSRMITVPGYGHDVMAAGCMPALVTEFIEEGSVADLDTSCVEGLDAPPFFVSPAGPGP